MLIQRLLLLFALVVISVGGSAKAATSNRLAAWFQNGRCAAFNGIASPKVPYARNDNERIEWMHRLPPFLPSGSATYLYDPRHGVVFRSLGQDSTGSFIVRTIGAPPTAVRRADLGTLSTTSGIRLGTTAATVVQKLGKPYIVHSCGLTRYAYLINRQVGGNSLEFTITNGRVSEIYQTYGD